MPKKGLELAKICTDSEGILHLGTGNEGLRSDLCYLTTKDQKTLPTFPDALTPLESSKFRSKSRGRLERL